MNYAFLRHLAIIGFEGIIKNKKAVTINGTLCKTIYVRIIPTYLCTTIGIGIFISIFVQYLYNFLYDCYLIGSQTPKACTILKSAVCI